MTEHHGPFGALKNLSDDKIDQKIACVCCIASRISIVMLTLVVFPPASKDAAWSGREQLRAVGVEHESRAADDLISAFSVFSFRSATGQLDIADRRFLINNIMAQLLSASFGSGNQGLQVGQSYGTINAEFYLPPGNSSTNTPCPSILRSYPY